MQFSSDAGRQQKAEFDKVEDTKAAKKLVGTGGGLGLGLGGGWFDGSLSFGVDTDQTNLRGFGATSTDSSSESGSAPYAGLGGSCNILNSSASIVFIVLRGARTPTKFLENNLMKA